MAVFILSSFWGKCNVCFGFARSSSVVWLGKRFSNLLTHPRISSQLFFSFVVVFVLLYVCVSCGKYKFSEWCFLIIFNPETFFNTLQIHINVIFLLIRLILLPYSQSATALFVCRYILIRRGVMSHYDDMTQQFIKGQLDCDIHTMNYRRAKINHPLLCEPFTSASGC